MKLNIWGYNINSIRKKVDIVIKLIRKFNIDILFLTETKIKKIHEKEVENDFYTQSKDVLEFNYKIFWNSNSDKYYHGTAFIYKDHLPLEFLSTTLPTKPGLRIRNQNTKHFNLLSSIPSEKLREDVNKAHNTEGRIITARLVLPSLRNTENIENLNEESLILVGTYVPNSGTDRESPLKRLAYRTEYWDIDLYRYLKQLEEKYSHVIWLGDLNVCKADNDMTKSALKRANFAGVTPEERDNFNKFLDTNYWIDTWENCNPYKKDIKERATYGVNSMCKLRLDYLVCSPSLAPAIRSSLIDQHFEGSDHVPMGTLFSF